MQLLDRHAVVDLGVLLARDHDLLDRAISFLLEPNATVIDRRQALDAARVSFAAHADAEAEILHTALGHVVARQDFAGLVAQVLAAHRTQESILRRMDHVPRGDDWMCSAVRLRRALLSHAEQEQSTILRALRNCLALDKYELLAGAYASAKMRALGLMTPLVPPKSKRRTGELAPK